MWLARLHAFNAVAVIRFWVKTHSSLSYIPDNLETYKSVVGTAESNDQVHTWQVSSPFWKSDIPASCRICSRCEEDEILVLSRPMKDVAHNIVHNLHFLWEVDRVNRVNLTLIKSSLRQLKVSQVLEIKCSLLTCSSMSVINLKVRMIRILQLMKGTAQNQITTCIFFEDRRRPRAAATETSFGLRRLWVIQVDFML